LLALNINLSLVKLISPFLSFNSKEGMETSFGKGLKRPHYRRDVGHYVAFISVSSNAQWIAGAGGESLTVLDATTLENVFEPLSFEKSVKLCLFSPDSSHLIYGAQLVYFLPTDSWDLKKKKEFNVESATSSAAFSKDGKKLYIGTYDKNIFCFEEINGEWTQTQRFSIQKRPKDMAVDPHDKYLVVADKDGGGLSMFELAKLPGGTGTEVVEPQIEETVEPEVGCVCFSPDGRYLAWGGSLKALLMAVEKPTDIEPLPVDPKRRKTRTINFSSDSRWLAYGGASHEIRVIDSTTIQPMFFIKNFPDGIWACQFAPGNHWVVSGSYSRKITVAQLFNRTPPAHQTFEGGFCQRSISKFGDLIVSLDNNDPNKMVVHDFSSKSFKLVGNAHRTGVKKTKGNITVISQDGSLIVWNSAEGNQVFRLNRTPGSDSVTTEAITFFDYDTSPHGIGISDDNRFIITDDENEVHITSVETGEVVLTQSMDLEVFAQGFSSGSNYFAIGYGCHLAVFTFPSETLDEKEVQKVMSGITGDNVNCISFSKENTMVAASSEGVSVFVWDIESGRQIWQLKHDETADLCQFSTQRDNYLLTATSTGTVSLFDMDNGQRCWIKVAGANFQNVSFAEIGGTTKNHEHIVIVYNTRVEYYSMELLLELGPNLDDFVESVHLDNDYTERVGQTIPYLCCERPSDLAKGVEPTQAQGRLSRESSYTKRAEPLSPKGKYKNARDAFDQLKQLSQNAMEGGETNRPLGKTAVQRAIELDAEECLNRLLKACPGSAVACGGLPIREALTMGNKGMLSKVLMAACDDHLSYSAREIVTKYLKQIAEKAPQVLAKVLNEKGTQEYEVEGYNYCHCSKSIVKVSPHWGAGHLWEEQKPKEGSNITDKEPLSKVSLSRVLFPNMGSPDILEAITESGELALFENQPMANVISAMWKHYYRKRYVLLFSFYFSMFAANLLSAILAVEAREPSRNKITPLDDILTIYLLILGVYNILYETYQAYLNFEPDLWNLLDWCYYILLVVNSSLNLAGHAVWELGAVNVVLSCLEVLFYMRGFSYTGFLVRMLVQVFADLRMFMLVVCIIIMAFAGAFYTLYDGDTYNQYNGVAGFIVWTYLLMNQIIWETAFYEDASTPWLATALICLFLFMTAIILLNFIIAILSDTFERVSQNQKAEGLKERAGIILELNFYLTRKQREKVENEFRWVHLMRPWDLEWAKAQKTDGEWDSKETEQDSLQKEISALEERIRQQQAQIEEHNTFLANFIQDLKKENDSLGKKGDRRFLFSGDKPRK